MDKKVKTYRWIGLIITLIFCLMVLLYFLFASFYFSRTSLEWFVTPFVTMIIFIFLIVYGIVSNLKIKKKHPCSFQYLQQEVIPHIQISREDHQKAIQLFEKFMFQSCLIIYISMAAIFFVASIFSFLLDLSVFMNNSKWFIIISFIIIYIILFIIILLRMWLLIKIYKKHILSILDSQPTIFIDFTYLYMIYNYAIIPIQFYYEMNIAVALSRLGEYEYANIYLKCLWNEENKMTKKSLYQLTYYFNCYIFALRLHLDNAHEYKNQVFNLFKKKPSLSKKKNTAFIMKRIEAEEAMIQEDWDQVIKIVKSFDHSVYYDYMLYVAYSHTHDECAQEIYNRNKNNPQFIKLLDLDKNFMN